MPFKLVQVWQFFQRECLGSTCWWVESELSSPSRASLRAVLVRSVHEKCLGEQGNPTLFVPHAGVSISMLLVRALKMGRRR